MKTLGKVLSFIDNHHKETFYLILALTVISEILFIFYHTPVFGYANATIEENLKSTLITVMVFMPIIMCHKRYIEVFEKRDITYFYIILLASSVFQIFADFYCIFVGDIPLVIVFLIYIPLFIALIVWLYRIRHLITKALNIISNSLKR